MGGERREAGALGTHGNWRLRGWPPPPGVGGKRRRRVARDSGHRGGYSAGEATRPENDAGRILLGPRRQRGAGAGQNPAPVCRAARRRPPIEGGHPDRARRLVPRRNPGGAQGRQARSGVRDRRRRRLRRQRLRDHHEQCSLGAVPGERPRPRRLVHALPDQRPARRRRPDWRRTGDAHGGLPLRLRPHGRPHHGHDAGRPASDVRLQAVGPRRRGADDARRPRLQGPRDDPRRRPPDGPRRPR